MLRTVCSAGNIIYIKSHFSTTYNINHQHSSYININTSVNNIVNWVYVKQSSGSLVVTGIQIIAFALSPAQSHQKETNRLTERLVKSCLGSFNILIARSSYFQLAAQYSTSGPKQDQHHWHSIPTFPLVRAGVCHKSDAKDSLTEDGICSQHFSTQSFKQFYCYFLK